MPIILIDLFTLRQFAKLDLAPYKKLKKTNLYNIEMENFTVTVIKAPKAAVGLLFSTCLIINQ